MNPLPRCRALAAGLLLPCPAALLCAEAVPTIVVTAVRAPQAPREVIADVVVIDAEQIARAAGASLTELLQMHGGVEITANGGPGQVSGVFLRGTNSNHVVLLIDGVRVNSATTGTNAFEHIALAQIQRIEVLRGAASSLYGADAIGGVIQIFTRANNGERARVGLGSDRLRDGSAGITRDLGAASWSLQAGVKAVDAFSATNAGNPFSFNPDDDPYSNRNVGGDFRYRFSDRHSLTLRGLVSRATTHFDAGPGGDDVNQQRLSSVSLESDNRITSAWRSSVRVARGSDHLATQGAFPSRFDTDQDQFTWQNDVGFAGADFVAGLEWRRESVDSDTAYTQSRRDIRSLFVTGRTQPAPPHQFEASLRHDDNSQFGHHTTGRLGYGWLFAPAWRATAAAASGFRAPSFNDLYFPPTFGFAGNPNLRPERSRGGEAALRFERASTVASLTAFHNRIDELIVVDPTFSTVVNLNAARIRGATLAANHDAGSWRARAEWTHQRAEDATSGLVLPRRARHFGHASLLVAPGPWQAGAELAASGERYDNAANTAASRLSGYGLLNLFASLALNREFTLSVRVNNATDKRYELAQGYNTPGRNVVFTLDARWF